MSTTPNLCPVQAQVRPPGTHPAHEDGPHVAAAQDIPGRSVPAVGAGASKYADEFPGHRGPLHPDPGTLARIAADLVRAGVPADLSPMYLRRPDATVSAGRKRVTPA